jgi:intein-encoded DNA endonuclease-like protein
MLIVIAMPRLIFNASEIVKHTIIDRELKKDEIEKGRLALGTEFVKGFETDKEVIEVIRRKKT